MVTKRLASIQDAKRFWQQQQTQVAISLTGILHEVSVAEGKRTGQLYAKGTLKDVTGTIDLIVFPRTYEMLADQFKTGNAVEVSGVLRGEEEALPKLVVESLSAPETTLGRMVGNWEV